MPLVMIALAQIRFIFVHQKSHVLPDRLQLNSHESSENENIRFLFLRILNFCLWGGGGQK